MSNFVPVVFAVTLLVGIRVLKMTEVVRVDAQEVERWLGQFLTPNTRLVQEAMVWLKSFLKKPYSVPVMCDILLNGNNIEVRLFLLLTLGRYSCLAPSWNRFFDPTIHRLNISIPGLRVIA